MTYPGYPKLESLSIPERIEAIRETVLELLENGKSREELLEIVELYEDEEQYEAAQGVLLALNQKI